jgi:hypothetical protein
MTWPLVSNVADLKELPLAFLPPKAEVFCSV